MKKELHEIIHALVAVEKLLDLIKTQVNEMVLNDSSLDGGANSNTDMGNH